MQMDATDAVLRCAKTRAGQFVQHFFVLLVLCMGCGCDAVAAQAKPATKLVNAISLGRNYDALSPAERREALAQIAEASFAVFRDVMPTGLRASQVKLERVAHDRDWLEASRDPRARLLALSLRQGIDRVVIVELYRAAAARSGATPGHSVIPKSVDGELAEKLLVANRLDPEKSLARALALDGVCARSTKSQGWQARDFLSGNASFAGVVFGYEKELATTRDTLLTGVPHLALSDAAVADQIFSSTVFTLDRGSDIRIFASIHRDLAKLPKDRAAFDAEVKRALAANPYFHFFTADLAQPQDIELTMREYAHPMRKEFIQNLAPALLPFVHPDYELPEAFLQDDPKFAQWRGLWLPQ